MTREQAANILWWASKRHYPGDQMDITEYDIEAFDIATAALRSPWVKTSDRLPEDYKPVLVTYVGYTDNLPHNDAIAVYAHKMADNYAGAWYWQDSDGVYDNPASVSITHWMPLPKLPGVEG